jgi:hypothetical protein
VKNRFQCFAFKPNLYRYNAGGKQLVCDLQGVWNKAGLYKLNAVDPGA